DLKREKVADMKVSLENKTVLITNVWLSGYNGSVLNCLSLASALKGMGCMVEIATFDYNDQILKHFRDLGIEVRVLPKDNLSRQHYDIIWAHHSILLDHVLFSLGITTDRLIASSLSPYEPLECLPYYANECSLCLANSMETRAKAIEEGVCPDKVQVFPNYVDRSWLEYPSAGGENKLLKKVAVVSNHVPAELSAAIPILKSKGCIVDIYGTGYKTVLIEPEVLSGYDLVISIGKTVQFSMALQIPVYCYDRFGGPGYIRSEDMDKAAYYNFSGRGFEKKNAESLAEDIISRYEENKSMLPALKEYVEGNCSLEKNLANVVDIIFAQPVLDCAMLVSNYPMCKRHNEIAVRSFLKVIEMRESSAWRMANKLRRIRKKITKLKEKLFGKKR
ncbi:MAG: hypothetical protein IJA26_08130, partial [Clostridia bacterium]|nr:hypothetical protein [Clostridia bacterium]